MHNAITLSEKKLCDDSILPKGSKILVYNSNKIGEYIYYCDADSFTIFKSDELERQKNANVDANTVDGFNNFLNTSLFGYDPVKDAWPIVSFTYVSGGECIKTLFTCKLDKDEKTFTAIDILDNIEHDNLLELDAVYYSEDVIFNRDDFSKVKVSHVNGEVHFSIVGFDLHSNKLLKFLMEQVIAYQVSNSTKNENATIDKNFCTSILNSELVKIPTIMPPAA